MIIMALDLSTKSTGWCVNNNEKISFGLCCASGSDVIKRIFKITEQLKEVVSNNPGIEKVILEEVRPENDQYGVGNQHTQKVLMWLQASVIFMLYKNFPSITIDYIYPNEWRSACGIKTGRGVKRDTLKQQDILFAKTKYGVTVGDDIADAIGISHAYLNKQKTATKENEEFAWG